MRKRFIPRHDSCLRTSRFLSAAIAVVTATLLIVCFSTFAAAQDERSPEQRGMQPEAVPYQAPPAAAVRQQGTVITPPSSIHRPEDAGLRAHTNYLLFAPAGRPMSSISPDNTFAEYPASIACVYKVGPSYPGCVPANNGLHATGGWGAIALVDAYDDPTAASDLAFFDSFFLLPVANFTKVIANSSFGLLGGRIASCSGVPDNANLHGWDLEEALDIEWAHAMAPAAKIILVEACSNSPNDLLYAEYVAGLKVSAAGGGEISNSWSEGEFAGEVGSVDDFFYRYNFSHITYFASAGDSGWGAQYPSSSPWVVSAGGTTINRDALGNFLSESCWAGSGGGVSAFEMTQSPPDILNGMGPWANFQYEFAGAFPGPRQTPDISFDADPASGVWVFNTDTSGFSWYVVGGTSVGSPALAGIVNASNNRLGQTPPGGGFYHTGENNLIYSQLFTKTAYKANFYDVTTGSNGIGHNAGIGYDQCTGVGSPRGKLGK
jgi:kumamolisin